MSHLIHINANETVPVQLYKDGDTWVAKTRIKLSAQRLLNITTRRHITYRDLRTIASVSVVGDGWERHVVGSDFVRTLESSAPQRITKQVTRAQHEMFFRNSGSLAQLKQGIEQFYVMGEMSYV